MDYKEAKKVAEKVAEEENEKLLHDDFVENGHPRIIIVEHGDGSVMRFCSAKCERHDGEECGNTWFTVCTEHHGTFVYHWEDVKLIRCETVIWRR